MRSGFSIVFVVAAALAGCGGKSKPTEAAAPAPAATAGSADDGEQPFEVAIKLVCDAPVQCNCMDADGKAVTSWLEERLTSDEVFNLVRDLGALAPTERPKHFEEALTRANIAPADCAFYTKVLTASN